jgi:predicted ATPase
MAKVNQQNQSINDNIEKIKKAFKNGRREFEPFIEYVRFPHYKNFERDTQITFDFPFTVFIGKNGSGKSSALHALFGIPRGNSTGNFWFSTQVDPIEENQNEPHCHIHGYRNERGEIIEALKTRINSKNYGLDYWEPSRPLEKYKMKLLDGSRNPAISKKVVYLDFRAELSAFDKYFYFGNFKKTKTLKTKQDIIRKWSVNLSEAIERKQIIVIPPHNKRKCKKPTTLTKDEIQDITTIIGKNYAQSIVVEHNFYDGKPEMGTTTYFYTDSLNYSEAFAGRGEFAVVKLIHEMDQAPEHSLILLDEPEVSLHPGAQEKLKQYLLAMVLKKKLQVVISTHSRVFVEGIPENAIKLFNETDSSQFHVQNSCHYLEAFRDIGIQRHESDKTIIIVEDITTKILIESFLKEKKEGLDELFRVEYYPGGAESLLKTAVHYSEENEKHKFILLDGDKRKESFDPRNITVEQRDNLNELKQIIKKVTGIDYRSLAFRLDGGNNQSAELQKQKCQSAYQYLEFLHSHLAFLPKSSTPEEIIWDDEEVKRLLNDPKKCDEIKQITDIKEKILKFAETFMGNSDKNSIESVVRILAQNFVQKHTDSENYEIIDNILENFKNYC